MDLIVDKGTLPFYLDLTSWYAGNFGFWLIKIAEKLLNWRNNTHSLIRSISCREQITFQ
jgi:type IV secretory pathway TrbD component